LRFLEDPSDAVAAGAVDAVCRFQEENTVRYLLRMFGHSSAVVRQRAADCFTNYFQAFQEQQAVIHRKYLAVPYLAALLADPDVNVRIAAARALGASEKFRGVPPLIDALGDADVRLRDEAVRALGLIRDRYALSALLKLLADPNLEASTYAELFIALKRLDYDGLDKALAEFGGGRGEFSHVRPERRLAAFVDVLESSEGVVLPREKIQSLARAGFEAGAHNDEIAVLFARLAAISGISRAVTSLMPLTARADPRVRSAAYLARFKLDPENRLAVVGAALRDPETSVRSAMLRRVAEEQVRLPDSMLTEVLQHEETRLAALNAVRGIASDATAQLLTGWVEDETASKDIRLAALQALSRSGRPWAPTEAWFRTASDDLRIATLACEARTLPAIYVSRSAPPFLQRYLRTRSATVRRAAFDFLLTREELWAKQEVLTLLQNDREHALRHHVMQALPTEYFSDGGIFLKIAGNSHDPLRYEALRRLRGASDGHTVQGLLAIARDEKEDERSRVLAGVALPANYSKDILLGLLGS
jgi:HEAT repeat protein